MQLQKEKGRTVADPAPELRSRLLARSAAWRAAPPLNRGRRTLIGAVVLNPLLNFPADQSAGSRAGGRRDVAVADVLAECAADDHVPECPGVLDDGRKVTAAMVREPRRSRALSTASVLKGATAQNPIPLDGDNKERRIP